MSKIERELIKLLRDQKISYYWSDDKESDIYIDIQYEYVGEFAQKIIPLLTEDILASDNAFILMLDHKMTISIGKELRELYVDIFNIFPQRREIRLTQGEYLINSLGGLDTETYITDLTAYNIGKTRIYELRYKGNDYCEKRFRLNLCELEGSPLTCFEVINIEYKDGLYCVKAIEIE